MAQFEIDSSSMDALIRSLNELDLFSTEVQEKMLTAGAESLQGAIRSEANNSNYRLERISDRLSKSKVKKDKNGNYYMTVSVSGKNDRGERNATVAFVLNYGRREKYGKISGSYFWTRAVKRTERVVLPLYEEIVKQELTERGFV